MGRGPGGDSTDLLLPPQMAQALDTFKRWCVMRAFVRVRGMDTHASMCLIPPSLSPHAAGTSTATRAAA